MTKMRTLSLEPSLSNRSKQALSNAIKQVTARGASLVLLAGACASVASAQAVPHCTDLHIPVALSPTAAVDQSVAATLCLPASPTASTQLDLMTPGTTYNRSYWDWPQNKPLYSYVDKTLSAGRATLNYDRIGTGRSSHPFSLDISVQSDAYVLHQLVQWVKAHGFTSVNLIGHSYGSIVSVQEAGTYHDTDRLVITGLTHALDGAGTGVGVGLPLVIASLYPATLDPQFLLSTLDAGYLTTLPGSRGPVFYSASADPNVIAYDEAHKDLFSEGDVTSEAGTFFLPAPLNTSNAITEPVLLVLGQEDALFCTLPAALDCTNSASLFNAEALYYSAAPSITAKIIPDTGHDLALHPSANQSFQVIENWITTH